MQSQTAVSLVALTAALVQDGMFHSISAQSFPDVVDCRNLFLTTWFDRLQDSTHMLFVDADMQFEPALVRDMLLADKPLVGCIYPKKKLPLDWVGSAHPSNPMPEGNLLELEGMGCGVMLIRRDCVEEMLAKGLCPIQDDREKTGLLHMVDTPFNRIIRAFDKVEDENGRHLSEDYSFCWRHRNAGGKVWAVINHPVCHIGMHQYVARYSDLYAAKSSEAA